MRKLKSMITSKAMITAASLLLQLVIIFVILFRFSYAYVYYLAFSYAVSLVMCLVVINKRTNSGYKIGWLVIFIAFPLFGAFLYLTVNGEGGFYVMTDRVEKIISDSQKFFSNTPIDAMSKN